VNRVVRSVWLCASLCLAALPLPQRAAAAPAATAAAGVEVDLSGLEPLDPEVRRDLAAAIAREAAAVAEQHGLPAAKLHIAIGWRDAATFDYLVKLRFDAHDGLDTHEQRSQTGPDAAQKDLGQLAAAALERMLAEWESERDRARATTPTPTPTSTATDAAAPRGRTRLAAMGWSGIAMVVVGGATLGVGVGMTVLDTADASDPLQLASLRPAGVGVLAGGAALVIVGAVLAGVDAKRQRRGRAHALAPMGGRGLAGLVWHGRF
jgi:hypothetical protein